MMTLLKYEQGNFLLLSTYVYHVLILLLHFLYRMILMIMRVMRVVRMMSVSGLLRCA